MTASKMNAVKAKNAKAAAKKAVAQKSVEVAAEAKLLAADAEASASAGSSAPLMATFAAAAAEAGAEGASGSSGGGMGSTALILGGIAVAGGVAAAAAGGGSDNDDLKVVEAPKVDPVYSVTASSATAKEGPAEAATSSVVFSVSGGNSEARGTTVQYKITGVDASDIDIPLEGSVQVNNDNSGSLRVTFKEDAKTEGLEKMKIVIAGKEFTVDVEDASKEVLPAQRTVALSSSVESLEANVFNSLPDYTPGGNDLVNTLQDEDVLTGAGVNPTLNVTIGSVNDAAESFITPTLKGVETVNVEINDTAGGLDFQNATGLKTLNLTGLTRTSEQALFGNLDTSTTNLGVDSVQALNGDVAFGYREESLTGTSDAVNVSLNSSRFSSLILGSETDGGADDGYSFETINLRTTGINDIDAVTIVANGQEDVVAEKALDTTKQVLNITADAAAGATGSLEINALDISGVDSMSIVANQRVDIAANKAVPLSSTNDGILSSDLESLTITGAANVMIDGLGGEVGSFADTKGLTVNAAVLTGNLRLGIEGSTAGDDRLSVTSGTGNDEIVTYGDLGGDIVTNAGNDTVSLGMDAALLAQANQALTVAKSVLKQAQIDEAAALAAWNYATAVAGDSTGPGGSSLTVAETATIAAALSDLNAATQLVTNATSAISQIEAALTDIESKSMLGTASISTGDGNDKVTAAVLTVTESDEGTLGAPGKEGYDDVFAASISTGSGDDTVVVSALQSTKDWDNGSLTDSNADDTYAVIGATIDTGAGADSVTFTTMQENAKISTGAGNDTVTAELGLISSEILQSDTDANRTLKGPLAASGNATTNEVGTNGEVDKLGAVIDLGDGDDTINFTDVASVNASGGTTHTIVGVDAEILGGTGNNTLNVTALDAVTVAAPVTVLTDVDPGVAGIQSDVNALIKDIDTINLTIANQVENDAAADAAKTPSGSATINETLNNAKVNDNVDTDGAISLDVRRVDSDLDAINLVSKEQAMLMNPGIESYSGGTTTTFTLDNVREAVKVTLSANELNGVTAGRLKDNSTADVTLNVSATYAEAVKANTTFTLDINAANVADQSAYDVDLNSSASKDTDPAHVATASLTDDDDLVIENLVINLKDSASHTFDLDGFDFRIGDSDNGKTADTAVDPSLLDKATSLKIATTTDGTKIVVNDVSADKIEVLGAADVTLSVTTGNVALDITTGSGDDVLNLVNNSVDDNNPATASYNEQDKIDAGLGTDRLIVDGSDSLGVYSGGATINDNDEVFIGLKGIEEIEFRANGSGGETADIVLDDDAQATGVKAIYLTQTTPAATDQDQVLNVGIGLDFENDISITALGQSSTSLTIDNDGDIDLTIIGDANDGATVAFTDAGINNIVDLSFHINDASGGTTTLSATASGAGTDGSILLTVASGGGTIDKITLLEDNQRALVQTVNLTSLTAGKTATVTIGGKDYVLTKGANNALVMAAIAAATGATVSEVDGVVTLAYADAIPAATITAISDNGDSNNATFTATNGDNGLITVTVSNDWATTAFELDASKIDDVDGATTTGGMLFSGAAETDASLTVSGTQNNDDITGGAKADTLSGNAGDDTIRGGSGGDTIDGGVGNDELYGDVGDDTITGGAGNDRITGGAGADNLVGGAGKDIFIYTAVSESNGTVYDSITDFVTGSDKLEIALDYSSFVVASGGSTGVLVDVSTFADSKAQFGDWESTLSGSAATAVRGDWFYASEGSVAVDFDGNGDITSADYVIDVTGAVVAADVNFKITGTSGDDTIIGGAGADVINGGSGSDTISFGSVLAAGDTAGDAGDLAGSVGIDTITFNVTDDTFYLSEAIFGLMGNGTSGAASALAANLFTSVSGGGTNLSVDNIGNGAIVFDTLGSDLYFIEAGVDLTLDATNTLDELVAGKFAIKIADLTLTGSLVASDFMVIA